ncbi:MAG TPA: NAD(P)/FAD-dependent oxidoreductase [Acidimicrobiales bacterium]|nr:NAD(P)/FAD-dependent oxidoreductase [Acidimicrobiales bacterium]
MRVLIVGGGIAGLTLAAKLAQQGRRPVVVERRERYGTRGYALGLHPFGSCVLHGLGVYQAWAAGATEIRRYELADERGEVLSAVDLDELGCTVGPSYDTTHDDLVRALRGACEDVEVRMGTTVRHLDQREEAVAALFSDGTGGEFDLVCGCDGTGSEIRRRVFGDQPTFDTGWVAWTWGGPPWPSPTLVREHWLPGAFFGAYPVGGGSTFVTAVPIDEADPAAGLSEAQIMDRLARALDALATRDPSLSTALAAPAGLASWALEDVQVPDLHRGRVVLCGDAGLAFLPTAGLGAATALRSAAALGDELSRADARLVPLAAARYARRVGPVVSRAQVSSHRLARAMFRERRGTARARDEVRRHLPTKARGIRLVDLMREPL